MFAPDVGDHSVPHSEGRDQPVWVATAVRANLDNEDDDRLNWALLRDASEPKPSARGRRAGATHQRD